MMKKSTYSPESYGKRVNEWLWSDVEGGSGSFPRRTEEEIAHRRVGDVEKAVLTILKDLQNVPSLLGYWLHEFLAVPAYHMDLWDYLAQPVSVLAESVLPYLIDQGYHWNLAHTEEHLRDLMQRSISCTDGELRYPESDETPEWRRDTNQAVFLLVSALVVHREQGEEGEDTYTAAGPFTLTTSLAAALVDYHKAVTGVLKDRLAGRYPQK